MSFHAGVTKKIFALFISFFFFLNDLNFLLLFDSVSPVVGGECRLLSRYLGSEVSPGDE